MTTTPSAPDGAFARTITEQYRQRCSAGMTDTEAGRYVRASEGAVDEAARLASMSTRDVEARLAEFDADQMMDLLRASVAHPHEDLIERTQQARARARADVPEFVVLHPDRSVTYGRRKPGESINDPIGRVIPASMTQRLGRGYRMWFTELFTTDMPPNPLADQVLPQLGYEHGTGWRGPVAVSREEDYDGGVPPLDFQVRNGTIQSVVDSGTPEPPAADSYVGPHRLKVLYDTAASDALRLHDPLGSALAGVFTSAAGRVSDQAPGDDQALALALAVIEDHCDTAATDEPGARPLNKGLRLTKVEYFALATVPRVFRRGDPEPDDVRALAVTGHGGFYLINRNPGAINEHRWYHGALALTWPQALEREPLVEVVAPDCAAAIAADARARATR